MMMRIIECAEKIQLYVCNTLRISLPSNQSQNTPIPYLIYFNTQTVCTTHKYNLHGKFSHSNYAFCEILNIALFYYMYSTNNAMFLYLFVLQKAK